MDKSKNMKVTMRSIHREEFEKAGWPVTDQDIEVALEGFKEPFFRDIVENERLPGITVDQVRMFVNSIVDKALTSEEAEEVRLDLRAKIEKVNDFHSGKLDPSETLELAFKIRQEMNGR